MSSEPPQGVFPSASAHRSQTPDLAQEQLFAPLFRVLANGLGRLRWLQQGRVHLYVLYIVVTLMALLAWVGSS